MKLLLLLSEDTQALRKRQCFLEKALINLADRLKYGMNSNQIKLPGVCHKRTILYSSIILPYTYAQVTFAYCCHA